MDYGLFLPINNNGWIMSTTSPQFMPTFQLNQQIVRNAEQYGMTFALSMIKLRGFGGVTEHWGYGLESFTLMAGLAAVTESMDLYASVAVPTLHPAMVARMAVTIDSIAPGRFGINIVAGWNKSEYATMGLWPGDEFYEFRYDYASEYVAIMKELWTTGRSDFQGRFFQLDDCVCKPLPSADIKIVSAGLSPRGHQFTAEYCDYNFTAASGPEDLARVNASLKHAAEKTGREILSYPVYMVIFGETDEEAARKVARYDEGTDREAIGYMLGQAMLDKNSQGTSAAFAEMASHAVMGDPLVGSPATIAGKLNELAAVEGTGGIMVMFDEFLSGTETFGREVMPLLD